MQKFTFTNIKLSRRLDEEPSHTPGFRVHTSTHLLILFILYIICVAVFPLFLYLQESLSAFIRLNPLMRSVNHWNWQKSFFFFSCSPVRWNQPPCPLNRLAHMLRVWAASVIVRRATLRSRADPSGRPEDVGHPSAHMSPPGRSLSFWLPELLWIGEGGSSGGSDLTQQPWL